MKSSCSRPLQKSLSPVFMYMCIQVHVFSSCFLFLAWCSLYLLVCMCLCIYSRSLMLFALFTYKRFYMLVWLMLYSFHVNDIRSFRVTLYCWTHFSYKIFNITLESLFKFRMLIFLHKIIYLKEPQKQVTQLPPEIHLKSTVMQFE